VLINPAEAMNAATANALLKMLEEPSSSTLFLLISHNPRRLLPTVRSRCQTLVLARPEREEAVAWLSEAKVANPARALAHAGGMPLAASREAIDNERLVTFLRDLGEIAQTGPAAVAGQWEAWLKDSKDGSRPMDKHTLIVWLQKWLFDLVAVKLAGRPIYHPAHDPELRTLASRASARGLIDCYNELLRIRAVARHPLNPRLFLEDMLSRYARAVAGRN
jgi:DNA polymerase-3 subunit delta'